VAQFLIYINLNSARHDHPGWCIHDSEDGLPTYKDYRKIESKTRAKGIDIMCPVVPATQENARDMIANGVNMLILGNDMHHFQNACKNIMAECVTPIRNS